MKKTTKEFKETLKIFMEDYEGFDWKNGQLVLVNGTSPFIITENYKHLIDKFADKEVLRWTHTEDVMVITLK